MGLGAALWAVWGHGLRKGVGGLSFSGGLGSAFGTLWRPLGSLSGPLARLWETLRVYFYEKWHPKRHPKIDAEKVLKNDAKIMLK